MNQNTFLKVKNDDWQLIWKSDKYCYFEINVNIIKYKHIKNNI